MELTKDGANIQQGRAIFRLPGESLPQFVAGDLVNPADLLGVSGDLFCIQPFDPKLNAECIVVREHLLGWKSCYEKWECIFPTLSSEPLLETTTLEAFAGEIEGIRGEITLGHLEKAVAARVKSIEVAMDADVVWVVFEQLHLAHPNAFLFLIMHPEWGCWMGATPENLLTVEGGVGKVMALAGTLTASQSGWTDKERLEQTVTSRFIAEALESSGIVGAKESQMGELAMGNIKHLVSEWAFGGVSDRPWRLLEKLHPTPAVGGYPQHLACEWLKSNEGFDRGLYAGYLGWVGAQKSVFYVTLRCSKIVKNGYTLFAGCGVNAGSEVEVEWQETRAKMDLLGQYLPE